MEKGRLEAFSDGVIAVIITIMVLDLKAPERSDLAALAPLLPVFVTYVLSFVNVGIYWNNHHHLLRAARTIDGRAMWANLHLLFWLSLMPFTTAWAGEHHFTPVPTAVYGFDLTMCAIAYTMLQQSLIACDGPHSELARAMGSDWKGKFSFWSYIVSVPVAFVAPLLSGLIFIVVASLWFVPDRRIERGVATERANATRDRGPRA